jgi:hypothetical protein
VLVRDILACRVPEPPAQFLAMRVIRLEEALLVSFGAMSGSNPEAVDRFVKIVRELDCYHGFVAAERWSLPVAPEAPEEIAPWLEPHIAKRIRPQMAPQRLEKIESAPGNGMPRRHLTPKIWYKVRRRRVRSRPCRPSSSRGRGAPPAGPEMAAQKLEKTESAPGNGMARLESR